jgi:hypothetical protein
VRRPEACRRPDPLVAGARRHPDVGDHDVGRVAVHGLEQLREVRAGRDHLEVRLPVQEHPDPLADQQRVLGDDDSQAHPGRVLALFATPPERWRYVSADCAALCPHIPWTPAPGGVAAEQRYTPGTPVR